MKPSTTDREIDSTKTGQERDTPIPPPEHPHWLVNAGFRDIDVFSRKLMFSAHGEEDTRLEHLTLQGPIYKRSFRIC